MEKGSRREMVLLLDLRKIVASKKDLMILKVKKSKILWGMMMKKKWKKI